MTSRGEAARRGRLSLSARLLAGLVAITAVFLVVMGAASTLVLKDRLGIQFDAQLRLALARNPAQLAASAPAGDMAVVISPRTGQGSPLIPGAPSSGLQSALSQLSPSQLTGLYARRAAVNLHLPDGTAVRAAARPVPRAQVARAGVPVPSGLRVFQVVARPLSDLYNPVSGVIVAELITGGALIVLLAVCGRWLIGRGLSPLRRMAAAAHRISTGGDLTARMPDADPVTEAGQLGLAVNIMLDRIQYAFADRWQSEQKVRTFAADASHELRTPLTTIRGYAELYRQGALGPDELARAMRRIEEESTRMSQLVAELLELARLDRSSSLSLTTCDLAGIVADAAADAAAVEPARPVRVDAPGQLLAVADEPRIRQVLANLLANVREHTPASTPVLLRLTRPGHGVLIEVSDAGPGMTADDAARAFDRFHSRSRSTGGGGEGTAGAGLGLPIVQAIAAAHGGQATLESAPGQGTSVRVWLPDIPAPPPPSPGPAAPPGGRAATPPPGPAAPPGGRAATPPPGPAAPPGGRAATGPPRTGR